MEKKSHIERKKGYLKKFDSKRIFSENEIKDLCMTYKLRFLSIRKYSGNIDDQLVGKIREFEKLYSGDCEKNVNRSSYMIVAPAESFNLSPAPIDPLLFYPIGSDAEGNSMYYLVHKWGKDISVMRWFSAWKWKSFFNWFVAAFIAYWILPVSILVLTTGQLGWSFLLLGSGIHILFARYWEGDYSSTWLERRVSEKVWNSEYNME